MRELSRYRKVLLHHQKQDGNFPNPMLTKNRYFSAYIYRWGLLSILLVLPSCLVSQSAYFSYYKGNQLPQMALYTQTFADVAIFYTQPLCILISWLVIDPKKVSGRNNPSNGDSHQLMHNGRAVQISLTPSPTEQSPEVSPIDNNALTIQSLV